MPSGSLGLLPALIAVTTLVATNHLALWLRHRHERLHLSWSIWSVLGLGYLVARLLQQAATTPEEVHFAVRLQFAIGYAMMVALYLVVRDQVKRPVGPRLGWGLAASTVLIGAALFLDGAVTRDPVFTHVDAFGATTTDTTRGALVPVYLLLLTAVTGVCVGSILRHGGSTTRARRIAMLVTIAAVSAAGMNDLLITYGLQSARLTEYATVAIVLSAHHVMVHDYHLMMADMESLVAARTRELQAATTAARSAEASFRALIDVSPDAVMVSRQGRILFANAAAARFLGRGTQADLIGRDAVEHVRSEERDAARAALDAAQAPGFPASVREERYAVDAGPERVAETVRVPLLFEGVPSVVAIIRDLTDRRQMEEKLQFTERMASLGTLAAGVAHEINNPMSYILANLEFLREALVDGTSPGEVDRREIEGLIGECEDGAHRVVHIVRDLKAFSRRADEEVVPLALEDVLDTSAEMALVQIRHRANLERDYGGGTMVLGNRVRLGQVFLNLVVNAAQAIPEGDDPNLHRVVLRTYLDRHGMPVAEVEDSGRGIDPSIRARIFDPFFTTKPVGVGTGLGLSSALGIVSALGGAIEVDGRPGGGTIMRVRLPRLTGASIAPVSISAR